jgi:hypothetical protein
MKKTLITSALLAAITLTAGAQSFRLADKHNNNVLRAENMDVTPTADRTILTLDLVLDSLNVPSNRYRAFTPILRSEDSTYITRMKTIIVSGRRQDIVFQRDGIDPIYRDNCVSMRRHNGKPQTYNYTDAVERQPWHQTAEVLLECDLCGCGNPMDSELLTLMKLEQPNPLDLIMLANQEPDSVKRSQELHGTAFINFVVDRWEMKPDYMSNAIELRKITDTLDIMVADPNITVERIMIHGWASPESPYEHNRMLATNRAQSLTDWVRMKYQLPASAFAPAEATPENWIGLREALEKMTTDVLPHRDEIHDMVRQQLLLDDVQMRRTADATEALIKRRYPQEYNYLLREVYPWLRRSDYEITFRVRTFNTTDECLSIYRTKPHQLSLHEFWRVAQTMEPFSDEYNRCMQMALNYYPDQPAAMINLANVALMQNDQLKAETLLLHAGNGAAAENARAVLCILRQQYDEAARHLDNAAAQHLDVSRNREAIEILSR